MSLFFLGFSSDCSMQYIAGVTKLSIKYFSAYTVRRFKMCAHNFLQSITKPS